MADQQVYLDHNATTPLHPQVKTAMTEAMEVFGNPSSLHQFGRQARKLIEQARNDIAFFINAGTEEIIFVGSGSEANNTVFNFSFCQATHCTAHHQGRMEIITTRIEHPCVLESSKCMCDRGINVDYLDVDRYGKINIGQLEEKLNNKTVMVSVMMANNEIGTIQDIKAAAAVAHARGAYFHTDAVQAVGKIFVDVKELGVDFLSFSAHKIYGPKGVGALFVKKGVPFCPFIRGGHQERGRRAGTENTLGIIGFAKAIEMRKKEMAEETVRLGKLKEMLREGLLKNIPQVQLNGHPKDCLASTLNVSFAGVEGEAILLYLDLAGIAVSTGSACSSGSLDPSHVLLATGTTPELAHSSIRMSLGRQTTQEDINYVITKMTEIIEKLRGMSTVSLHER
ncbi:MAG: cysteine desulfurase [Candidatus Omnitrophica bacterium]|nr:cysteine desulfurase [Candidatus Omnitrophota bacterium]MCG2703196.1 cysteine desulfurase [Candidatus Omnitrophota bacterium]